jgi:hypothetical protein
MSCCGKQRKQLSGTNRTRQRSEQPESDYFGSKSKPDSDVYFKYFGRMALTFIGPYSRRRYRFERSGAIVAVDPRDKRAMANVPLLRQVRSPKN